MRTLPLLTVILSLCIAPLAGAQFRGNIKKAPGQEILVKPIGAHRSAEAAAKLVNGFGTVLRYDEDAKGFIVKLIPPYTLKDAYARLSKKNNLQVSYAKEGIEIKKDDDESDADHKPDYWQMREWYLNRRKNSEGKIDWKSYEVEQKHRAEMPIGHVGRQTRIPGVMQPNLPENNWSYIGPTGFEGAQRKYFANGPLAGRVNALAYDPTNESIMYAGSAGGGVWKTIDGGNNWVPLSDAWADLHVSSIAIDPASHNTIYVGTGDYQGSTTLGDGAGNGYGAGIMKSTDGGAHWDTTVAASSKAAFGDVAVSSILISPQHTNILIATTGRGLAGVGKVWRSTDSGVTWKDTGLASENWGGGAIGAVHSDGKRNFIVVAGKPDLIGAISRDEGATWSGLSRPSTATLPSADGCLAVACSPLIADTYYLMYNDKKGGSIWKTSNRGSTFFNITGDFVASNGTTKGALYNWGQAFYNWFLGCYSWYNSTTKLYQDALVAGNIDVQIMIDTTGSHWASIGGPTWTTNANLHNDQHAIAFSRANDNHFAIGNDGGVSLVDLNPNTGAFTTYSTNLTLGITQLYSVAVHPTFESRVIAGAQDNGTPATSFYSTSTSDFADWTQTPTGGDGSGVLYYEKNPAIMYCGNEQGSLSESRDGGQTWTEISYYSGTGDARVRYSGEPIAWVAPIAIDNTNGYVYLGTDHVWRYNIATKAWTRGAQDLTSGVISALAVSADGKAVYVGTSNSSIYLSTDNGANFVGNLAPDSWSAGLTIGAISIAPESNAEVLVGFATVNARNLWRCLNTSAATPAWIDVNGPSSGATMLVKSPINAVVRDFDMPSTTWYVGTDIGMFMTTDGGSTWSNITGPLGLPNVQVNALVAHAQSRQIYAATYGRGIWRIHNKAVGMSLSFSPNPVDKGKVTKATLTLDAPAPSGGLVVKYESSAPSAAPVPASKILPKGATSDTFDIAVPANAPATTVLITATVGASKTTSGLQIVTPYLSGNSLSQSVVYGGSDHPTWTITMSNPAGAGGVTLGLKSSDPTVAKVPASVFIGAGGTSASVTVTTFPISTDAKDITLTVTYPGGSATVILTVKPNRISSFTFSNPKPYGGSDGDVGQIDLEYYAATAGVKITLVSDKPTVAKPAVNPLEIGAGGTNGAFTLTTFAVTADTVVTVTATTAGASKTASVTVLRNYPTNMILSATECYGGSDDVTATVNLRYYAQSNGVSIAMKSDNTAAATIPSPLVIGAGGTSGSTTITTLPVTSDKAVNFSATLNGVTASAALTIRANVPKEILLSAASAYGGSDNPTATVNLKYYAQRSGVSVALRSSDTSAAACPATLEIGSGGTSGSFTIATYPVAAAKSATIYATLNGVTVSAKLLVKPITISSLALSAPSYYGGTDTGSGTVNLVYYAPSSGVSVAISSSNTAAATADSPVNIGSGGTSGSFNIYTQVVGADTPVVITASLNGVSKTANVLIKANRPAAISLSSPSVRGGVENANGTVTLEYAAATTGVNVAIASSNTAAAIVSTPVSIGSGGNSGSFDITTKQVATATPVTISATLNGKTISAPLTVNPIAITGYSVPDVRGGLNTTGTFTFETTSTVALVVTFGSDSTFATVPASVTVPAGNTGGSVLIKTTPTATDRVVYSRATLGPTSQQTTFKVLAPSLKAVTATPFALVGGNQSQGLVSLNGTNGNFTKTVSLSSSNTAAVTVAASSTVAANASSAPFTINTYGVDAATTVTITATLGAETRTVDMTIKPAILATLKSPVTETGGGFVINAIAALNGQAGPSGAEITLRNSNPAVSSVPASVTVPYKSTYAKVPITTKVVTAATSTIVTATYGSVSRSVVLKIHPAMLVRVTTSVPSVQGGTALTGTVNLDGQAGSGGVTVQMSTSDGHVVISTPITIPAGKSGTSFSITTKAVTANTTVTITATAGSATASTQLQLTP